MALSGDISKLPNELSRMVDENNRYWEHERLRSLGMVPAIQDDPNATFQERLDADIQQYRQQAAAQSRAARMKREFGL